jgi:hypothetical protein
LEKIRFLSKVEAFASVMGSKVSLFVEMGVPF